MRNLREKIRDDVMMSSTKSRILIRIFFAQKNVTHEKIGFEENRKKPEMAGASNKPPTAEDLKEWKELRMWFSYPDHLLNFRQRRFAIEGPAVAWDSDQADDEARVALHRFVEQEMCRERGVDHVLNEEVEEEVQRRTRQVLDGLK